MAEASSLSSAVKIIKSNICQHGVYAPYVRFTVLGSKYGDVSFTTVDISNDNSLCCITNFENVKNGSGQANAFTVTIAYVPSQNGLMYSGNNLDFSNVNLIDEILNINKEPGAQTKCKIQYGYSYPMSLLTPTYEGVILDYGVEVNSGILYYTITGYSGLAIELKDSKITIEGSNNGEEAEMKKPTNMVQEIYDKYIKDVTNYVLEWADDTYDTDKEIEIEPVQNVSTVSYIKTLLDNAEYTDDDENTALENRSQYVMIISDILNKDGKKTIRIERYDPSVKKDKENTTDVVRFSWMGSSSQDSTDYSSNAMVINFKANFKGSVTMAYDYSSLVEKAARVGINSAGDSVEALGTNVPVSGSNTENDNISNLNLWASRLQYAYGATLVLIGIPYEIRILENIYVAPMIAGQEHHTGGLYKITKVTDIIDTSGFTTTLELFKNQGDNTATRTIKRKLSEINETLDELTDGYVSAEDAKQITDLRKERETLNEIIGDGGVD